MPRPDPTVIHLVMHIRIYCVGNKPQLIKWLLIMSKLSQREGCVLSARTGQTGDRREYITHFPLQIQLNRFPQYTKEALLKRGL